MGSPSVARGSRPRGEVAALPWNQWQRSPGMGGRLALESVAALAWNQWQRSCGIAGSFAVESVAGLAWNTQKETLAPKISPILPGSLKETVMRITGKIRCKTLIHCLVFQRLTPLVT